MKRCLIHIGSTKTGSSSIQMYMKKSAGKVAYYPLLGEINHELICVIYDPYEEWPNTYKRRNAMRSQTALLNIQKKHRDRLIQEIRNKDEIVLSGEHLVEMTRTGISELKRDLIESGFSDFHILLYIRDPAEHYMSLMQQKIKFSTTNLVDPNEYRFPYEEYIRNWEVNFPGMIVVREFSRKTLHMNDVVKDFLMECEKSFDKRIPQDLKIVPENESLTVEQIAVLQRFRKNIYPGVNDNVSNLTRVMKYYVLNHLEELAENGTKPVLKKSLVALISNNHKKDLAYLGKVHDIHFSNIGVFDPTESKNNVDLSDIRSVVESYDDDLIQKIEYTLMTDFLLMKQRKLAIPIFRKRVLRRYFGIY